MGTFWLALLAGCLITDAEWTAALDLDGDGVTNLDDCSPYDEQIGEMEVFYVDADGDGCGVGEGEAQCPDRDGSPPEGYAAGGDEDGNCMSEAPTCVDLAEGAALWVGPDGSGEKYTYHRIQDAIDAASDGDTICVAPGTYVENLELGSLEGEAPTVLRLYNDGSPEGDVVVQAADALPVLRMWKMDEGTEIAGFTFTGGAGLDLEEIIPESDRWWQDLAGWWGWSSPSRGVYEGSWYMLPCASDQPYTGGGGMLVYGSHAALSEVSVTGNSACEGGGAWVYSSDLTWTGGDLEANAAGAGGGLNARAALIALDQVRVVENGVDAENYQGTSGGGLAVWDQSTLLAQDVTLGAPEDWGPDATVNRAVFGGGLVVQGSEVVWNGGEITSNQGCYGGGVYAYEAKLTYADVTVSDNEAMWMASCNGQMGGGMRYGWGVDVALTGVAFHDNHAESYGGGIAGPWSGTLDITDTAFVDNQGYGGAGWVYDATTNIRSTLFRGNRSEGYGGALYFDGGEILVEDSLFLDNIGVDRGGAVCAGGSDLWISRSAFLGNTVEAGDYKEHGGALYLETVYAQLDHLTVVGNRAGTGGGIYMLAMGSVELTNSILAYNTLSSFDVEGENMACDYSGYEEETGIYTTDLYSEDSASSAPGCRFEATEYGNSTVNPIFVAFDRYDFPEDWDLHLCVAGVAGCTADSPLLNAALDGADLGAYGRAGDADVLPSPETD